MQRFRVMQYHEYMDSSKGVNVGETFMAKVVTSAIAAIAMYWMQIPEPVVILLIMMGIDLFMGSIAAAVNDQFSAKKLWIGILKKTAAFPMLVACHYTEAPLHLAFDLDNYVALALVMYEFISVVESYARLGGPVPSVLIMAADKAKALLSAPPDVPMKQVEVVRTEPIPTPGDLPLGIQTTKETHQEPVAPPIEAPKPKEEDK